MSAGASVVAHGVHYGVLAVGLAGLLVLLGPRFAGARQAPASAHEQRVRALREQLGEHGGEHGSRLHSVALARPDARGATSGTTLLPVVVTSSVAAAAVHAAVGPQHFAERALFGVFFAAAATAQILWAAAVVRHPTRALLIAGAAGNLTVVALWAYTRTFGLPFGLLPDPESIGPWDVCCGLWELSVAAGCLALLRRTDLGSRVPRWHAWSGVARTWAFFSLLVLVSLSLSGASA